MSPQCRGSRTAPTNSIKTGVQVQSDVVVNRHPHPRSDVCIFRESRACLLLHQIVKSAALGTCAHSDRLSSAPELTPCPSMALHLVKCTGRICLVYCRGLFTIVLNSRLGPNMVNFHGRGLKRSRTPATVP